MKKYALTFAILLCHFISVHAAIINGFSQKKSMLEIEIRNEVVLLSKDNTDKAIRQIEKKLKQLRKKYALVLKKYLETEQLLAEFENIDPTLFERVSKITNLDGTLTHVYVRYVDRTSEEFTDLSTNHFKAFAYTSVSQSPTNKNVCTSLFGTNTINVTIGKGVNEKLKLGHEFGHVLYLVQNLSDYNDFCNKNERKLKKYNHGHSPFDPSYTFVESIEKNFGNKYKAYLNSIKKQKAIQKNRASK